MNYKQELLYKRYITSCIYESTELDEGRTWNKLKQTVGNLAPVKWVNDTSNEWFGTFYKNNVYEVQQHLKKCVEKNVEFAEMLNFETEDYKIEGQISKLYVVHPEMFSMHESILHEDEFSIYNDPTNAEAKAIGANPMPHFKQKGPDMTGADENNYQSGYNTQYQDDDTIDYEKLTADLRKIDPPTKEQLLRNFPQLEKNEYSGIYNDLLKMIAKQINGMFKYGVKKNPEVGSFKKEVEPDPKTLNKVFSFEVKVKFVAKNPDKVRKQRIDDKNDEGVLPIIAEDMKNDMTADHGELRMYNRSWDFTMEVLNAEDIIKFETENLKKAQSDRKEVTELVANKAKELRDKAADVYKKVSEMVSVEQKVLVSIDKKTALEMKTLFSGPAKAFIAETRLVFANVLKTLSSDVEVLKAQSLAINGMMKKGKIKQALAGMKEVNPALQSKVTTLENMIVQLQTDFALEIDELAQAINKQNDEDKANSENKFLKVETEEEIAARAKKDIVQWLLRGKAQETELKEEPGGNRSIYTKDLLCGRRDDPRAVETHFEIILTPLDGENSEDILK